MMTPAAGSPPRMRGKPRPRSSCQRSSRITPAHAGKTTQGRSSAHPTTDHPRACGENCNLLGFRISVSGSPPRMRGKLAAADPDTVSTRITPRACGENFDICLPRLNFCGSPPRMRGKPRLCKGDFRGVRITPAHAGKTSSHATFV